MGRTSPVVAQFEFAARLRKRREELGLPAAAVSKHLGFTRNFYSAVENSRSLLATAKLPLLIEVLEFDDADAQTLTTLLEQARTPGWWQPYLHVLDDVFVQFLGLESGATAIKSYESLVFNGLLQCPEYASAVVDSSLNTSPIEKQRTLEVRLRRQEMVLAESDRPEFTFVISEAVLWQHFGPPPVLLAQLVHVRELMDRMTPPLNLKVRLFRTTPFGLANASTLVIMDFANSLVPQMAYREAGSSLGVSADPELVDRLRLQFEHAVTTCLEGPECVDVLDERIRQLREDQEM